LPTGCISFLPIVLLSKWPVLFFNSSFFKGLHFATRQTVDAETKPVTRCDLETVAWWEEEGQVQTASQETVRGYERALREENWLFWLWWMNLWRKF